MRYIADLHIHSPFSRATSKQSTLQGLAAWAGVKGIDLVGSGDFTHPGWFEHLTEHLVAAEPGFYRLKERSLPNVLDGVESGGAHCRFILTAEISSIYKRGGRVRKVHNLLVTPDFSSARAVAAALGKIGNITSDGRPILGLDARDLLEIFLEKAPDGFFIPAHIWTPWFSLFGSRSGFDAIEECFSDLTSHIFALETGLSSDPAMNRLVSGLDRFTLVSNSDCHSPAKLGREANLFETAFDFFSMKEALQHPEKGFAGTIEFFPEEGKYHLDGHRKCGVSLLPRETEKQGGICPVCCRPLTVGVMHRVMELADRETPVFPEHGATFHSLIPLAEVLGEIMGCGPATKGVAREYARLINRFGSEFNILLHAEPGEIRECGSVLLGEAVERMRQGKVYCRGGFDGEFGVVTVFAPGEKDALAGQSVLFAPPASGKETHSSLRQGTFLPISHPVSAREPFALPGANGGQEMALAAVGGHVLVVAGPGTGKTFTLVTAVGRLLDTSAIARPLVITFTNRAADEVKNRLVGTAGVDRVRVQTFHACALEELRRLAPGLRTVDQEERRLLAAALFPAMNNKDIAALTEKIAAFYASGVADAGTRAKVARYEAELARRDSIDLDGVVPCLVGKIEQEPDKAILLSRLTHLFLDEFQDVNQPQYRLVEYLARRVPVFAIGDPDQAIYGFRGASPRFFFRFQQRFQPRVVNLDRNYRSSSTILAAAHGVIAHNPDNALPRLPLQGDMAAGGPVLLYQAATPEAEAEYVVASIEGLLGGISHFSINTGRSGGEEQLFAFQDIAVLYRLNSQGAPLAAALQRRGIPFQVAGVPAFYRAKEAGGACLFLLAAAGLADEEEMAACDALLAKTELSTVEHAVARFTKIMTERDIRHGLEVYAPALNLAPASEAGTQLLRLAGMFGTDLAEFAAYLRRHENGIEYDEQARAVTLMSMHAAKGLEFGAVFVTGVEEGLLPCTVLDDRHGGETDIAEERRLFFVAMTRAARLLSLSWSGSRRIFGRKLPGKPSPFVREIPHDSLRPVHFDGPKKKRPPGRQLTLFA